jgi:hypothetical protein
MTEGTKRAPAPGPAPPHDASPEEQEAERRLGKGVAIGLPAATVALALVVGAVASVPSALLVLASGALLGAIALLWASVRTLSGDAPLPEDLEMLAAQSHDVDGLAEQKRRVLRALKDLENERAVGRLDDADYESMAQRYRDEAKAVMKRMDERVAPAMAEAEELARIYLKKHGTSAPAPARATGVAASPAVPQAPSERRACVSCGASNEPDAAFCKQCGGAMNAGKGDDATA